MHELNGIQLAKIIRSKDKDCNIIFITSSEEFLIDGYSVFAVGYFLKPINENEETFLLPAHASTRGYSMQQRR